ncbi:MAG TPA: transposase [Thermoanaerobaculia bacterium]
MSRPLRLEYPGSFWHITARGNERNCIFVDDHDRRRLLELLGESVRRFRWILLAYALMPNHIHLVLELTETTLSRGMKWLNGCYSQCFNRRHKRVGHLFQGRFGAFLIEKETYMLEVLRYVVLNPVRAGIVSAPREYEWSSHHAVIGVVDAPQWLAVDNVLAQFGSDECTARERYSRFVDDGIGSTRRPWDDLVGQMYLGGEQWVESVREKLKLKPRATEHPLGQRAPSRPDMQAVIAAVAEAFRVDGDRIRYGRGGSPRMVAAWLGCYEAMSSNVTIAAALRLRSETAVTNLIAQCDGALSNDLLLRDCVDRCLTTLGRKNWELQT